MGWGEEGGSVRGRRGEGKARVPLCLLLHLPSAKCGGGSVRCCASVGGGGGARSAGSPENLSCSPCPPHPLPLPPHTRSPPITGARSAGGPENLLVATHTRSLLVYRGSKLAWSARGDTQPAAVAVADLGPALRGVIVTLDDTGALVVSYLGTDPMLTPVGLIEVWTGVGVGGGRAGSGTAW